MLITALRSKKYRSCMHMLVFVLLASWIFLSVTATCEMPAALMAPPEPMSQCSEKGVHAPGHHQKQMPQAERDCSLKPCFEAQPNAFSAFNHLVKADLPALVLCAVWTLASLFFNAQPTPLPRIADPPAARRIPLIYRFCTLLN